MRLESVTFAVLGAILAFSYMSTPWFMSTVFHPTDGLLTAWFGPKDNPDSSQSWCKLSHADRAQAELEILAELDAFVEAWNEGNMTRAMKIYKNDHQTKLVLEHKVVVGFDAIVQFWNDKNPDPSQMGIMHFTDMSVHVLCPRSGVAIGKWTWRASVDDPEPVEDANQFTVVFEKDCRTKKWRSVVDITSGL